MLKEEDASLHTVWNFFRAIGNSAEESSSNPYEKQNTSQRINTMNYFCGLAEISSLPEYVLAFFAEHPFWQVREAVSDNPNLPIGLILKLAHDEHPDVRYALAENHRTPPHILAEMCDDENPYVSSRAAQSLQRVRNSYGFGARKNNSENERTMQLKFSYMQNAV